MDSNFLLTENFKTHPQPPSELWNMQLYSVTKFLILIVSVDTGLLQNWDNDTHCEIVPIEIS